MREHGNSETSDQDFIWFYEFQRCIDATHLQDIQPKAENWNSTKHAASKAMGQQKSYLDKPRDASKWWQQKEKHRDFPAFTMGEVQVNWKNKSWPQTDEKLKLKSFSPESYRLFKLDMQVFSTKTKKWSKHMQIIIFHHAILIHHLPKMFAMFLPLDRDFSPNSSPPSHQNGLSGQHPS